MSAKKNKGQEPSQTGVIIIAVLNCMIGAALGFAFMSSFPANSYATVKDFNDYLESSEFEQEKRTGRFHYYRTEPARGRDWETKRSQLLQGSSGTLSISSAQINRWISSRFIPPSLDDVDSPIAIAPGVPNFSAQDEDNISLSIPMSIRAFGTRYDRTFYAKVHFTEGPDIRLVLDKAYLDCAPIPHSMVYMPMYQKLQDAFRFTDEYKAIAEAWQRVESLEVEDGSLTLSLR